MRRFIAMCCTATCSAPASILAFGSGSAPAAPPSAGPHRGTAGAAPAPQSTTHPRPPRWQCLQDESQVAVLNGSLMTGHVAGRRATAAAGDPTSSGAELPKAMTPWNITLHQATAPATNHHPRTRHGAAQLAHAGSLHLALAQGATLQLPQHAPPLLCLGSLRIRSQLHGRGWARWQARQPFRQARWAPSLKLLILQASKSSSLRHPSQLSPAALPQRCASPSWSAWMG